MPFGEGNGRFSEIIRKPDGWRGAPALDVLRTYEGRAVLAVPGTDTIIPPAVTQAVQDALAARARFTRFDVPDAEHMLGLWFEEHAEDRREFVTAVLTGPGDQGAPATRGWPAEQVR